MRGNPQQAGRSGARGARGRGNDGGNNGNGRSRSGDADGKKSNGIPRETVLLGLFGIAAVVVVGGLVFRTVIDRDNRIARNEGLYEQNATDVAKRGTIYDRNGEVLASSVESYLINANPNVVGYSESVSQEERASLEDPAKAIAALLYKYLGKDADKTEDDYYEMLTREGTAYVVIQRRCDKDVGDKLMEALEDAKLDGVFFSSDTTRVYPNGTIGSQVVGTVGLKMLDSQGNIVDDEDFSKYDTLTESYRGTSGLELQYDSLLAGTDGSISREVGRSGLPIADGSIVLNKATDGEDVVCSIDIKLQQKAESSLKKACKKYESKGGSVTVMDASTGEIYATASYSKDKKAKSGYSLDVGKLWSVSDVYEPGSTFKSLTAVSVLSNSKTTTSTVFSVPASLKVYNTTVTDSHERSAEDMTLTKIIAESSNIGTVLASRKVELSDLYKTYTKFGIGSSTGIDFPGESAGILADVNSWNGVQAANVTFGQGVSVTGMQLVRAYGALEQGGTLRTPHFLVDLPNNKEKAAKYAKKYSKKKSASKKSVCDEVTKMLRSVVISGTGKGASIKGYKVVGKTGTAEIASSAGGYLSNEYITSFCGWLDNTNSDLVCLVTLDRAKGNDGAGVMCGGVFAEIMAFAADRYQITTNSD